MFENFASIAVLVFLLFLGDGQQNVNVAVGGLALLALWWDLKKKNKLVAIPKTIFLLWSAVVVYGVIGIFFSDSPGQSLYGEARLIEAFIVYSIGYSIATRESLEKNQRLIVIVATLATIIWLGMLLQPSWQTFFTPMNLFFPSYGHNHLVDLIIFGLPIALFLRGKNEVYRLVAISIMFIGLLYSYARGVWIVAIIGFILGILYVLRTKIAVVPGKVMAFACVLLLSLVVFIVLPETYVRKSPLFLNARSEYWLQAVRAIEKKPLFGSGLGTFYLQSKKLETWIGQETWFAHSTVLESLVELGIIGAFLFFSLMIIPLKRATVFIFFNRSTKVQEVRMVYPLFAAVILTAFYATFEFNLNFFVIWMLFFGSMGLLIGSIDRTGQKNKAPFSGQTVFTVICLLVLAVFSLTVISAKTLQVYGANSGLVFKVLPYQKDNVKVYLQTVYGGKKSLGQKEARLILFFHRNDSDVLYNLARVYEAGGNIQKAREFYTLVLDLDPHNSLYRDAILEFFEKNDFFMDIAKELHVRGGRNLQEHWIPRFYAIGLKLYVENKPSDALIFWKTAAMLSPSSSHMWIEYASMLLATGNQAEARHALETCEKDQLAGPHCKEAMHYFDINEFPPVGFYKGMILLSL